MAKIGPKDFLIDLGSGDGRIVITAAKKFGAQGFGVDLDTYLLKIARDGAKKEGVAERATFVEQNLFETDLSQGDRDLDVSAAGDEPETAAEDPRAEARHARRRARLPHGRLVSRRAEGHSGAGEESSARRV